MATAGQDGSIVVELRLADRADVGTKFRTKWKWSPRTVVEYVSFEAPRTWTAHTDGSLETNFTCTITPHPDGAKVPVEFGLIPHGLFTPIFPLFVRSFRKQTRTTAEKIRTTIDARHGHAANS